MKQLRGMFVNLQEYKTLIFVVTAVVALLVASPALQRLLVYPQTDFFTEMWLLGPEHMAENFPSNITSNTDYKIFLGITNHIGSAAYYSIQVKFRNQTQSAADTFNRTASSLPPLYSMAVFVADKETWELPVTFSLAYTYSENSGNVTLSKVNVNSLMFNGAKLDLEGFSAMWDPEGSGFFGYLFFELWIYNDTTGGFQYHQRYTSLRFNMTV
jgi:uncharacterized membrane protein